MTNANQAQHRFFTVFKCLPYTDEEWEQENKWRADFRQRYKLWANANPGKKLPLKHRPVHAFKHGPSAHSHEEARRFCEEALDRGAQMVEYSVWGPGVSYFRGHSEEYWCRRKGGDWYQK